MSKIGPDKGDLDPLIEDLMSRISSVEKVFLLLKSDDSNSLSEMVTKLSILEKAKFYVGLSYAINSLNVLVNLKLNRVDTKEHAVMKELERVQLYVNKIKEAETVLSKRTVVLDKHVVDRIITHDLSENVRIDKKNKEIKGKDAKDQKKLLKKSVHIRFNTPDTESIVNVNDKSIKTDLVGVQGAKADTAKGIKRGKDSEMSSNLHLKASGKAHKKHKNKKKKILID
ncbi:uncharacterized protein T551_01404 [Pneumocystis jirovecii RU7]|uniref:Exosome complex protein n=1 Tax=Pneumocystis jirovecii (strain RU7) TaxID=1408657 RepID=A0A0W4ZSJ2_PNEJ7|nr:uncharacterized protein T551_01404 [Pneumocystis jirovecii RU7]KTW31332.1 hypothetical protein T551_01404 [Pneumocystis jirovecii RU7]